MSKKIPDVTNVFIQLTAALSLLARAKGESPQDHYFVHSTPNVAKLYLDGGVYQVVMTKEDPEDAGNVGNTGG